MTYHRKRVWKIAKQLRRSHKRQWGGYLRPDEAIYLVDAFKAQAASNAIIEWLRKKKKAGDCRRAWVYFNLTEEQVKILELRK